MIQLQKLLKLRNDDVFFVNYTNSLAKLITEDKETYESIYHSYLIEEAGEMFESWDYHEKIIFLAFAHISFEINDSEKITVGEMMNMQANLLERYLNTLENNRDLEDYMQVCHSWNKFWTR